MSWWHETAALAAFCPITHQHLPPTELVKGCSDCLPSSKKSAAGCRSALQVAFPLPSGLCYVFREISFTGGLPWRKETACYFCSLQGWWYCMLALLTICCCFVAYKKNTYWLPLAVNNTHKKDIYYFFHKYAALESSLGLKLVLSEAAQWDGQWERTETGLSITRNSTQAFPPVPSSPKAQGTPPRSRRQQMLLLFLLGLSSGWGWGIFLALSGLQASNSPVVLSSGTCNKPLLPLSSTLPVSF